MAEASSFYRRRRISWPCILLLCGMLAKSEYGETLLKLSRDNDTNHSIEFCDNRLSRFVASKVSVNSQRCLLRLKMWNAYILIHQAKVVRMNMQTSESYTKI